MTSRCLILFIGLISFFFVGCSKRAAPPSAPSTNSPVLKIAVFVDGRLTVDGEVSTIPSLRESLRALSEKQGVVWYYREAGQQEAPPIAMEVMRAIVEARLPIRLSSHSDYSDAVGPNGKPIVK